MEKKKSSNYRQKSEKRSNENKKKLPKQKKLKIKQEEDKAKESKMWDRLNKLNGKFKTTNQSKKEAKKMSATIL